MIVFQNQRTDHLRVAVSEILASLCGDCTSPNDIVSAQLICSTSGKLGYLTAGLVYSSSDGRITASTIVNRLFAWLVSEDNPSILIDGTAVGLNQQCTTQLNPVTQNGCIQLLLVLTSDSKFLGSCST